MKKLIVDYWQNNINKYNEYITDLSDKAIELLKQLDGERRTQLLIQDGNNSSLLIGGGNSSLYIVTFILGEDEEFFNLYDSSFVSDEDELELTTGGQAGLFSRKFCVDFEAAFKAISYYMNTGKMEPNLNWEKDD